MGNISDKNLYPDQDPVKPSDYLIGTDGVSKVTKSFTLADIAALISEGISIETTLSNAATYQNDDLIDVPKSNFAAWIAGQEIYTAGLIQSYDSVTGTITFVTPITGTFKILILLTQ